MKISILSPNLSNNSLNRAYLLAKMLQRNYKVEIIGPMFGEYIWKPVAELGDVEYKFVKLKGRFESYRQLKGLLEKISGDVILATKPLFTSYGIGLFSKICKNRPLVLDIDDW